MYIQIKQTNYVTTQTADFEQNGQYVLSNIRVRYNRWGMWFIHGTKHHKGNQLQSLKLPCRLLLLGI